MDIIFTRRKFFEAQRFVFAALRILFLREKKSEKFRGPWLVCRVLRDDGGHKVMAQGRALATEVNEGARSTASLSAFAAKGTETVLRLGLEAPHEVDMVHMVGE
ncbi:MAG: hypothetical protein IJH88_07675 [Eggerthellaceae bacterium]|nr:hypothetical protein [Eggerthellaceae bacterium]